MRWEGFDASHDSWVRRDQITAAALISYEEFLMDYAERDKKIGSEHLRRFIGTSGEFSEINKTERRKKKFASREGILKASDQRKPRSSSNVDSASGGNKSSVRRSARLSS